jgi:hypothetical protein
MIVHVVIFVHFSWALACRVPLNSGELNLACHHTHVSPRYCLTSKRLAPIPDQQSWRQPSVVQYLGALPLSKLCTLDGWYSKTERTAFQSKWWRKWNSRMETWDLNVYFLLPCSFKCIFHSRYAYECNILGKVRSCMSGWWWSASTLPILPLPGTKFPPWQ